MNKIKYLLASIILPALLILGSCKKDDSVPSATEQQIIALQNSGNNWIATGSASIIKDGIDVTSLFPGFKLKFDNKTYSTENGISPVWLSSGTWDFKDNNPNLILRDDGVLMNVTLVSGTLTLTFVADAVPNGGRINSVSGEYEFQLVSE